MKRFTSLFRRKPRPTGKQFCRYCNAAITKPSGFWSLWRTIQTANGDPEYCPSSAGNHAHRPT
jgi:hypothetical protein